MVDRIRSDDVGQFLSFSYQECKTLEFEYLWTVRENVDFLENWNLETEICIFLFFTKSIFQIRCS